MTHTGVCVICWVFNQKNEEGRDEIYIGQKTVFQMIFRLGFFSEGLRSYFVLIRNVMF